LGGWVLIKFGDLEIGGEGVLRKNIILQVIICTMLACSIPSESFVQAKELQIDTGTSIIDEKDIVETNQTETVSETSAFAVKQSTQGKKQILDTGYDFHDYINILLYWDNMIKKSIFSSTNDSQKEYPAEITEEYKSLLERRDSILKNINNTTVTDATYSDLSSMSLTEGDLTSVTKSTYGDLTGDNKEIRLLINDYKDTFRKYVLNIDTSIQKKQKLSFANKHFQKILPSSPINQNLTFEFGKEIEISEPNSSPEGTVIGFAYFLPPYSPFDTYVGEAIVKDGYLKISLPTGLDQDINEPGHWHFRFLELGEERIISVVSNKIPFNKTSTVNLAVGDITFLTFEPTKTGEYTFSIDIPENNLRLKVTSVDVRSFSDNYEKIPLVGKIVRNPISTTFRVNLTAGEVYKFKVETENIANAPKDGTVSSAVFVGENPRVRHATYTYDNANRLVSIRYDNGYEVRYKYTKNGNLRSKTLLRPDEQ